MARYGGIEGSYGGYGSFLGTAAITGGSITGVSGAAYILGQSSTPVSGAADTNENALATITVPANAMGANGRLRVFYTFSYTNSANNKLLKIRFSAIGGTAFLAFTATTSAVASGYIDIWNAGATNSQKGDTVAGSLHPLGISGSALPTAAADTTAATTVVITGQKATAGETLTLESYTVELLKP